MHDYLAVRPTTKFLNGVTFTRVHFRPYEGHIFLKVYINGQSRECTLDTRTTTTHLPQSVDTLAETLPARIFRDIGPPVPGCAPRPLRVSISPSIQIGDYIVESIPVRSYTQLPQDPRSVGEPILGNDLFCNVSVTIDRLSETLIIASPSSSQAPSHVAGWDQILAFQSTVPGRSGDNLVILPGIVDNSPSLLAIDTGQFLEPLCIVDSAIANRIAIAKRTKFEQVMLLDNVSWSVGGAQYQTMTVTDTRFAKPFQALIGTPYLLLYRIGIDYSAHHIYLHKYKTNELFDRDTELERNLIFGQGQLENKAIDHGVGRKIAPNPARSSPAAW